MEGSSKMYHAEDELYPGDDQGKREPRKGLIRHILGRRCGADLLALRAEKHLLQEGRLLPMPLMTCLVTLLPPQMSDLRLCSQHFKGDHTSEANYSTILKLLSKGSVEELGLFLRVMFYLQITKK